MSDFMFVLDSHLTTGQNRAVAEIQAIATEAGMSTWLAGGAMRDMLRGAPIRDLDFVVEHDAIKTAKAMAARLEGTVVSEDPLKRCAELQLPGDTRASVSNARTEKFAKPGGKPQITPATIHEDLQRRDFTINAIALSLNRGARGLLVDPCNGQADLINRELRATNSYVFFDDPGRLIRLVRFRHALGFELAPRTKLQFENALLENFHKHVPASVVAREILTMALDPGIVPMLEELDSHGLLAPISKSLTGAKLNVSGLDRFEKLIQSVMPPGTSGGIVTFLTVLLEKLSVKERAEALAAFDLSAADTADFKKLDARAKKLEAALKLAKMARPSNLWDVMHEATVDDIMTVLLHSTARPVQDRIRAWYEKYEPIAMEVTDEDVEATGAKPGTPKFDEVKATMIAARLNAKPKKEEEEPEPEAEPMRAPMAAGRRG
jgi:tRNA nucleotidyltransferase/poly(A) polymerase